MFEVGKKYHKKCCGVIYECMLVEGRQVILKIVSNTCLFIEYQDQFNERAYQEYVPPKPLTFADLKVGEKFRRPNCPNTCIKTTGMWWRGFFLYPVYIEENTHRLIREFDENIIVERV